jgi:hypothetical protein
MKHDQFSKSAKIKKRKVLRVKNNLLLIQPEEKN